MSGIGHNSGRVIEPGMGWRRYAWGRARSALLPKMPIEVVRRRVRRADELGIDYRTYAGIRASTGRDIIALLFSTNALRVSRETLIAAERARYLAERRDVRLLALAHAPHRPEVLVERNPTISQAAVAPTMLDDWASVRDRVLAIKADLPADSVVVVGETWMDRDWVGAGRLAGFISGDHYFG